MTVHQHGLIVAARQTDRRRRPAAPPSACQTGRVAGRAQQQSSAAVSVLSRRSAQARSDQAPPTGAGTVAVLAGGEGRRIGGAKACVSLGARALIEYPLAAARAAGLEVVVIARRQSRLPELDCPLVCEPDHDPHPLHGVLSALEHAHGSPVVVLACDMPFVPAALLAHLAQAAQTTVCAPHGELQPLLGCYHPSAAEDLSRALEAGAGVRSALRRIGAQTIDETTLARFGDPDRLCMNVNDLEQLERAEAMLLQTARSGLTARPAAGR